MKNKFKILVLASILPFCSFTTMGDDDTTETETKEIILIKEPTGSNEKTYTIPATASVTGSVLNVQFTGAMPVATVAVTNVTTGSTTSTTLPTTSGTIVTLPVTAGMGVVTVTDEESGESVSGEFEIKTTLT